MRVLVLDTLIQTVDFDKPVRGGLVKSAILDVNALAERHDVFYMYYGKPTFDYKFHSVILDDLGSKDWCLNEGKKVSQAHQKLTKDIPKMIEEISSIKPDAMIIHVCSKSKYLDEISKKFQDIPRIYVFHDGVSNDDLFGTVGILSTIFKLKKYNSFLTVNSTYTRDSITKVMRGREADIRKFYPGLLEDNVPDINTYQLFDRVYDYFVYYDNNAKLDIVKNQGFSVNIGRFQKKKGVLDILQLHNYNNHVVKLYGVQDPVFDPGLKDYKKIKEAEEQYDNFLGCRIRVKKNIIEIQNQIEHKKTYLIESSEKAEQQIIDILQQKDKECLTALKEFISIYGGSSEFKILKRHSENKIYGTDSINSIPIKEKFHNKVLKKVYNEQNIEYSDPVHVVNHLVNSGVIEVVPSICESMEMLAYNINPLRTLKTLLSSIDDIPKHKDLIIKLSNKQ
jgi:hypothetical protein